jgi:hypothetical protein
MKSQTEKPKAKKKTKPSPKPIKTKKLKGLSKRSLCFPFIDSRGKTLYLTQKQHKFALSYLERYGTDRVQIVVDAGYDVYKRDAKGRKTEVVDFHLARGIASENLRKPVICEFITVNMAKYGWNDDNVEIQHLGLINQHDHLPTKQKSIDMWYKLKNKYPAQKVDHSGTIEVVELASYGSKEEE